jgi:hypothetical protein
MPIWIVSKINGQKVTVYRLWRTKATVWRAQIAHVFGQNE